MHHPKGSRQPHPNLYTVSTSGSIYILTTIGVVVAEDPPGQFARPQGIRPFRLGLYQRRHGCLLLLLLQLEATVDGRWTATTRVLPAGPIRSTILDVSLFFPWLCWLVDC